VNKRITQRFFVENENGTIDNPPSGCVIDKDLVEKSETSAEFDFFLIPQHTTQGCVLPTHFFVACNDSQLNREAIEKLTFALCHYYYNWAGPIKVPAPCMYAHKIAELFMNLGDNRAKDDRQPFDRKVNESLHFL
jgi:aubergine-like protein